MFNMDTDIDCDPDKKNVYKIIINFSTDELDTPHDIGLQFTTLIFLSERRTITFEKEIYTTSKYLKSIFIDNITIAKQILMSKNLRSFCNIIRDWKLYRTIYITSKYLEKINIFVDSQDEHGKLPKYLKYVNSNCSYHTIDVLSKNLHTCVVCEFKNPAILLPKNLSILTFDCPRDNNIILPLRLKKLGLNTIGFGHIHSSRGKLFKIQIPENVHTFVTYDCYRYDIIDYLSSSLKFLVAGPFSYHDGRTSFPNSLEAVCAIGDLNGVYDSKLRNFKVYYRRTDKNNNTFTIYVKKCSDLKTS